MDKTKEEFFVSKALTNSIAPNIRPELDSTKDPTDTETYANVYPFDEPYFDSVCIMCIHRNELVCNSDSSTCNYEPL